MINKEDLIVGEAYTLDARNLDIGIWDGRVFNGVRYKFGKYFMDTEYHWDNEDEKFGTAKPIRKMT